MLPAGSTAGFETGCSPSAIWIPISQVQAGSSPFPSTRWPRDAPSGTRTITSESEPITTGAANSPKRAVRRSLPARPVPRMRNSPPGIAAAGETSEICGRDSEFLRRAINEQLIKIEPSSEVQHKCGVNSGHHVIEHDASAAGDALQLPHGRRLPDIESSKQRKRRDPAFPVQGGRATKRDPLAHQLVDDHDLRIFFADILSHAAGGPARRG